MMYGWTGRILEVDLTAGQTRVREAADLVRRYIGGRALAARIAWEEIPAGIDAYDAENRIIIATGPFSGTLSPTSGRTVMSGISPRPYPKPWYTHSTLGGWFGPQLKYAGYDAIVIHGRAPAPVYLEIRDEVVAIRDAADLWGRDARQTQLELLARAEQKAQILAIGPAGENRVRFSTVQHAEENAAGHSGFGAVWGSKNLKAISVTGSRGVAVADPQALLEEARRTRGRRYSNQFGFLYDNGKNELTVCSQSCVLDCYGNFIARLPDGRRFSSNCLGAVWTHPHFGWIKNSRYSGGGVEVPAGHNFEASAEAPLHELCNSLGIDLWFRMVMQPWLIRCEQLGVKTIRGQRIDPTDAAWFEQFMRQLAARQGLGDLFGEDLIRAMDELEGELPAELIGLGRELEFNFGFPAHREGRFWDGEPLPFWVISALMHISESRDPTIGSHLSSLLLAELVLNDEPLARRQFRLLSQNVWGRPDALDPTLEGKAPVAIWSQHQHMLLDSLPLCDFAFPQLLKPFRSRQEWQQAEDITGDLDVDLRLFTAVTGEPTDRQKMDRVAERAFTLERMMLARAGRSRRMEERLAGHFRLPCKSDGTYVEREGFLGLMDEYYGARGWDLELGWPTEALLASLALDDLLPELKALRRDFQNETQSCPKS